MKMPAAMQLIVGLWENGKMGGWEKRIVWENGRMGNRRVGLFEKVGEWELGGWENGRGFRRGCEAEIGLCLCVRGKAIDASQENGEKVQVCPEGRGRGGRPMLGRPAHFYGQNGGAG